MLRLSRTVRFCLDGDAASERHNGYAGWPAMRGLGRYYELRIDCAGEPDPSTGYLINIKQVDRAFVDHGLGYLQSVAGPNQADAPLGRIMRDLLARLSPPLGHSVIGLTLRLTPFYTLTLRSADMNQILIRQQFDFSAAHRLHVPELSEEENRAIFGKCNNPAGHGHNYRLEVAVLAPIAPDGHIPAVQQLDALVDRTVIQQLDHKHLNHDVPQFADLNPSVENIAKVIYEMLHSAVGDLGVELEEVSVWETEKTVCTYAG